MAQVGDRVICRFLHADGYHSGEILAVYGHDRANDRPLVQVKLDRQEAPVSGVVSFDSIPGWVAGTQWQACWPEPPGEGKNDGAKEEGTETPGL